MTEHVAVNAPIAIMVEEGGSLDDISAAPSSSELTKNTHSEEISTPHSIEPDAAPSSTRHPIDAPEIPLA